jgi:hypothetical protein
VYYDDPDLTFADSIVYGCKLHLNYDEFDKFCKQKQWQYLMLYQNIHLLDHIGSFGNANPHYIKDWIKVEKPTEASLSAEPDIQMS